MEKKLLNKIKELKERRYYQVGDIYAVLTELEKEIKEYEKE